ncbi:MAG: phosphotransferase [Proteobacteria bacterium]|nr:phosphotransferase [Pseudomonadota bacterium]
MCLLHAIVAWDEAGIHARARSHRQADNPLRADGRLHAVNLCEYGAQAMAVHGGLLARRAGGVAAPGLLVALRAVKLYAVRVDDVPGDLDVHAQCLLAGAEAMQYAFRVEQAGAVLAEGRALANTAALDSRHT